MIWLSLKVSEYSGMVSASYTLGTARLSEFDLTSLQMLCHYPSSAKFCILRYSHIRWSERVQAWLKRGCEGMPNECWAPRLCCWAPALGGGLWTAETWVSGETTLPIRSQFTPCYKENDNVIQSVIVRWQLERISTQSLSWNRMLKQPVYFSVLMFRHA